MGYHLSLGAHFFKKINQLHTVAEFDFVVCTYQHSHHVFKLHCTVITRSPPLGEQMSTITRLYLCIFFRNGSGLELVPLFFWSFFFCLKSGGVARFTGNTSHLKARQCVLCEMSDNNPGTIQERAQFESQISTPHLLRACRPPPFAQRSSDENARRTRAQKGVRFC